MEGINASVDRSEVVFDDGHHRETRGQATGRASRVFSPRRLDNLWVTFIRTFNILMRSIA